MLRFVTTNDGKVREAKRYLREYDSVSQVAFDYPEIQSESLEPIVEYGAREAYVGVGADEPVFIEDSGLFIRPLGGFPGPYSSYVYDTLGIDCVADLVSEESSPRASFKSVIGYCDGDSTEVFVGSVQGRIVEPRGSGGFGYDPIFEHNGQTFAEMTVDEKNAVSHRGRALATFASWLAGDRGDQAGSA